MIFKQFFERFRKHAGSKVSNEFLANYSIQSRRFRVHQVASVVESSLDEVDLEPEAFRDMVLFGLWDCTFVRLKYR